MKQRIRGALAIAYSGGGRNGAYQVGVNNALCTELGFHDFRVIRGISTGSLVSVLMAMYAITQDTKWLTQAHDIYINVNNADILCSTAQLAAMLGEMVLLGYVVVSGKGSLYRTDGLAQLMDRYVKKREWQQIIDAKHTVDVGFGAVSLQTGKMRVFSNWDEGVTPETLRLAVLASSSIPVIMNSIEIDGEQWVDGGLLDSSPIERVWESNLIAEVDTVVAVDLNPSPSVEPSSKSFTGAVDILKRAMTILTAHAYREDLNTSSLLNALKWAIGRVGYASDKTAPGLPLRLLSRLMSWKFKPVVRVRPEKSLGDALKFDEKEMRALTQLGFRDTLKTLTRD